MARPQKNTTSNFTINGDLTALNLAKIAYTNDYNDLVTKPQFFNSGEIMLQSYSVGFAMGNTPDTPDWDSRTSDRCVVINIDKRAQGWTVLGTAGFALTGSGWDKVSVYCSGCGDAGTYSQDGIYRGFDYWNAQICNLGGCTLSLTAYCTILYKKIH